MKKFNTVWYFSVHFSERIQYASQVFGFNHILKYLCVLIRWLIQNFFSCRLCLHQFLNNFRCFLLTSSPDASGHPITHLLIHPFTQSPFPHSLNYSLTQLPIGARGAEAGIMICSSLNFYCEIFTQAPPPGASFKVRTSFLLTVFVVTVLVSRLVW